MQRWLVIGLALAAASGFALSIQAGAWWSVSGVEIGPHGTHHCMGGADYCGLAWLGGDASWARMGTTTWGAGLVATAALVLLAAAAAAKRTPKLLAGTTITAALAAAVTGTIFFVGFPGFTGAYLDRGVWLYGIGVFFGLAAAITVLRAAARTPGPPPRPRP